MDHNAAKRLALDLMETAETAIVTTIDPDGFPQTRAMFNLRRKEQFPGLTSFFADHQNDFLAYFTTNTSSAKIAHIKKNPRVSVYFHIPREFRGLMLGGNMEIVSDKNVKESLWQKGWETYYPVGPHDPDHTVLCLRPGRANYYHQLNFFVFEM